MQYTIMSSTSSGWSKQGASSNGRDMLYVELHLWTRAGDLPFVVGQCHDVPKPVKQDVNAELHSRGFVRLGDTRDAAGNSQSLWSHETGAAFTVTHMAGRRGLVERTA